MSDSETCESNEEEHVLSRTRKKLVNMMPREEDMEAAAKIVVLADDPYSQFAFGDIPGAFRVSEARGDPPSVIAIRDDTTEGFCSFEDELESVTQSMPLAQSMPLVLASLAQESGTMSAEALDRRFEQVIAMLVGMQQRQANEGVAARGEQQMSTSSLPSSESIPRCD